MFSRSKYYEAGTLPLSYDSAPSPSDNYYKLYCEPNLLTRTLSKILRRGGAVLYIVRRCYEFCENVFILIFASRAIILHLCEIVSDTDKIVIHLLLIHIVLD